MLLSIIIINYNTFKLTCDCLRSIKATTRVEHEIILVDNNSKECAAAGFQELFPDIHLIEQKENVGFGRANNIGVEQAKGKYVLLLNSDTIVHENTIDETVSYLEQHPNVDILGCKVLLEGNFSQETIIKYEGENKVLTALKFFLKRNTFFVETRLALSNIRNQRKKDPVGDNLTTRQEANEEPEIYLNYYHGKRIGMIVGVYVLLKKNVYAESKGFDPDFFMYYEESEWFVNRLQKYNVAYYPGVSVLHFHCGSNIYNKMNLQFHVSRYLFWYKMGYIQYFLFFLYFLAEIPSRLLVRLIYNRPRPSKEVPSMLRSIPYFFRVLRYSNKYGARPDMLKLRYLKKNDL